MSSDESENARILKCFLSIYIHSGDMYISYKFLTFNKIIMHPLMG